MIVINGVKFTPISREDVYAHAVGLAEMVRYDPSEIPAAARDMGASVPQEIYPRAQALEFLFDSAPRLTKDERTALYKKADKAYTKGRRGPQRSYLWAPDEAQQRYELETEIATQRKRRDARRILDEEERDGGDEGETYVDVIALGDDIESPKPTAGAVRDDGVHLLYSGEINSIIGVPGAFKTGEAALCAVETLQRGGNVWWADLDFNGAQATVARLLSAGAPLDVLRDRDRFRLTIGESPAQVLAAVEDAAAWLGTDDLAVMDSAGELVAMFGGNSNDADDWTRINRQTLMPLAAANAAVLLLDHLAKTAAGTGYATGTGAKKRTLGGAVYESVPFKNEPPRPEAIGKVALTLLKDRHGGTGYGVGECVAVLELDSRDAASGPWSWRFMPGRPKDERADEQTEADVAFVLGLDPFPTSRSKLQAALKAAQGKGWSSVRANDALDEARRRRETPNTFPITEKEESTTS